YILRYFKLNTSQDLYYRVGLGTIDNKKLKAFANDYNSSFLNFFKKRLRQFSDSPKKEPLPSFTPNYDKLLFGKERESLSYALAACCNPIPGDDVFGFITVNEGIKVHKMDCPNAISLNANYAYRIIDAKWVDSSSDEFSAQLYLSGIDNLGLVNAVTELISNTMHVNILSLSFEADDGVFKGKINVSVQNQTILNRLVNHLEKLQGIEKVTRG
ncbi:MAG: ACT domain-containing protein, partial [Flavobacteriaceae bacterium]